MSDPWAHLSRAERLALAAEFKAMAEDREFMDSVEADVNRAGWAMVWVERMTDPRKGAA